MSVYYQDDQVTLHHGDGPACCATWQENCPVHGGIKVVAAREQARHPKYGPCGCCLWTPPPTNKQTACAIGIIMLLFAVAMAWLQLYGMAHPGW